ncbi:Alpha/Beta hydrolase protein [Kalaharituber pfeilii]|nr:Alpha/Beta hydrolase protein [Kalaharituber pfeilii]
MSMSQFLSFLTDVPTLIRFVYNSIRLVTVASTTVAFLLSTLLYFKQNSLIYPSYLPEGARTKVPNPDELDIPNWEEVILTTPDKEKLSNYLLLASKEKAVGVTVLFLHGNAGNIGHRLPIARIFSEQMGCNIFLLSYRGYGFSTGRPSEKGLLIDAQCALDYLINTNPATRGTKIVTYGQSLGGALAIQLASRHQEKVAALVLENTFRSMRTLIPTAFPPARYLAKMCHQVWPSETTLPKMKETPMLFLSGLKDELVPPDHMRKLYDVCTSSTKVWKDFPNGTHNDTVGEEGYFDAIHDFIKQVRKGRF